MTPVTGADAVPGAVVVVGALDDVVLGDPTVLGGALVGTGEIGTLVGDDVDGQMLPVVDGLPGEGSEGFP